MPFSQTSVFPVVQGTDQVVALNAGASQTGARVFFEGQDTGNYSSISDMVLLGNMIMTGGATDANGVGTTIVGSASATAALGFTGANPGPATIVGYANAAQLPNLPSMILIGTRVLDIAQDDAANNGGLVYIGNNVMASCQTFMTAHANNVVIGHEAMFGTQSGTSNAQVNDNVVVGAKAGYSWGGANSVFQKNTLVGSNAAIGAEASLTDCICIGYQAGQQLVSGSLNIYIGDSTVQNSADSNNVVIGHSGTNYGSYNTLIGNNQTAQEGNRRVVLGYGAGTVGGSSVDDVFILETYDGTTQRPLLYGNFASHSLVVGNSVLGTNRDIPANAVSIVKIVNGTKGSANPIGGGYFYVSAGALHWVGSSGTDTTVAAA